MSVAKVERPRTGTLYVVATPIGNLEDMTARGVRILREVDLIAAEDTRQTRKLLSSLDIHTRLISYHKEREQARAAELLERLQAGENLALVSDAGTPALSDPGSVLVKLVVAAGIKLVPIPGPSALATAVSVAGLSGSGFVFLGFLPGKAGERKRLLQSLAAGELPVIFYESPHRLVKSLADCLEIFGDREVFVGRELTKLYEELLHRRLSEVLADFAGRREIKGELVVIVKGALVASVEAAPEDLPGVIAWYRDHSQLSLRDATRKIATDLGLPRSEVYSQALAIWDNQTFQER
ncbi:MAG TPA: 16S rRNA (cytidine(1402)-2'-O)-methyltransferase, partial [Desulfurivibrionaceae bacterium]|nr:16S rRNA (cytidine(1402)-2'-O)-methyltransferase [Desulfurivibrionaceae bacterium]